MIVMPAVKSVMEFRAFRMASSGSWSSLTMTICANVIAGGWKVNAISDTWEWIHKKDAIAAGLMFHKFCETCCLTWPF